MNTKKLSVYQKQSIAKGFSNKACISKNQINEKEMKLSQTMNQVFSSNNWLSSQIIIRNHKLGLIMNVTYAYLNSWSKWYGVNKRKQDTTKHVGCPLVRHHSMKTMSFYERSRGSLAHGTSDEGVGGKPARTKVGRHIFHFFFSF